MDQKSTESDVTGKFAGGLIAALDQITIVVEAEEDKKHLRTPTPPPPPSSPTPPYTSFGALHSSLNSPPLSPKHFSRFDPIPTLVVDQFEQLPAEKDLQYDGSPRQGFQYREISVPASAEEQSFLDFSFSQDIPVSNFSCVPILHKTQTLVNPFRPSCVMSSPCKGRTPKKVRFLDKLTPNDSNCNGASPRRRLNADGTEKGCKLRSDSVLDDLSLSSLSLTKKKPLIRKSKLTFLGERYCSEVRKRADDEAPQNVTPHNSNKYKSISNNQKVKSPTFCLTKMASPLNMTNKLNLPSNIKSNHSNLDTIVFTNNNHSSTLESFSKCSISTVDTSGSNININFSPSGSSMRNTNKNEYDQKHRTTEPPKSRRLLYKSRQRKKKTLPDAELPNLSGLTIGANSSVGGNTAAVAGRRCCCYCTCSDADRHAMLPTGGDTNTDNTDDGGGASNWYEHKKATAGGGGSKAVCGPACSKIRKCYNCSNNKRSSPSSGGGRSCSQEARGGQFEDTSMEELAAYLDNFLYVPKKMSFMAEMMYT